MDDIPFRLTEKVKPPARIIPPPLYDPSRIKHELASFENYDFVLEEMVLKQADERRKFREERKRQLEEEEKAKIEKAELSRSKNNSSKDDTTNEPPPVIGCAEKPGDASKDTMLQPVPFIQNGVAIATGPQKLNLSEFEGQKDVFDELELTVLDDMAELKTVLQSTVVVPPNPTTVPNVSLPKPDFSCFAPNYGVASSQQSPQQQSPYAVDDFALKGQILGNHGNDSQQGEFSPTLRSTKSQPDMTSLDYGSRAPIPELMSPDFKPETASKQPAFDSPKLKHPGVKPAVPPKPASDPRFDSPLAGSYQLSRKGAPNNTKPPRLIINEENHNAVPRPPVTPNQPSRVLHNPYPTLPREARCLTDMITKMGFLQGQVARAVEKIGHEDPKLTIDFLCKIGDLVDSGYAADDAEYSLYQFDGDERKTAEFLGVLSRFRDFGFKDKSILNAFRKYGPDEEKLIDQLTISS